MYKINLKYNQTYRNKKHAFFYRFEMSMKHKLLLISSTYNNDFSLDFFLHLLDEQVSGACGISKQQLAVKQKSQNITLQQLFHL